ncbi:U3 small nucleolar RNA-associated protein 13 [Gonapodya sp. JEL0774]|nr:U3 small nucleolar RNA-associated protein 13 [Gonapodya sp. JEL0774]
MLSWKAHEAPVLVSDFDPTGTLVATGSADSTVRVWDVNGAFGTHAFRGHRGLVSALSFYHLPKIHFPPQKNAPKLPKQVAARAFWLFSGGEDGSVRIWDLGTKSCLAVLKSHVSVVRGLSFTPSGGHCVSAGRDRVLCVWDLDSLQLVKTTPVAESVESVACLLPDHVSPSWRGDSQDRSEVVVATAGERGHVRFWNLTTDTEVASAGEQHHYTSPPHPTDNSSSNDAPSDSGPPPLHSLLYTPFFSTLLSASTDTSLNLYSLPSLHLRTQMVGENDEVVDLAFLPGAPLHKPNAVTPTQSTASNLTSAASSELSPKLTTPPAYPAYLALATTSPLARIYHLPSGSVHLLEGHTGAVVSLAAAPDTPVKADSMHSLGAYLVTGSRDRTARVWHVTWPYIRESSTGVDHGIWRCTAVLTGHTEGVGGVAVAGKDGLLGVKGRMVITGGGEGVVKVWDVGRDEVNVDVPAHPTSLTTFQAHTRPINHLSLSPNSQLLATASQDKTCRLFRLPQLAPLATLAGHKRGVWSARFSSSDQVVVTASADRTVRVWSIANFACLRVLEGHLNSVLGASFATRGMQIISAGSDGLMKLWSVRDQSCVATVDAHEDKVWTVEVAGDGEVVATGGADGKVRVWWDATAEEDEVKRKEEEDRVVKEQSLVNHLRRRAYTPAVHLALSLNHSFQLLQVLTTIISLHPPTRATLEPIMPEASSLKVSRSQSAPRAVFSPKVDALLDSLEGEKLDKVAGWLRDWNAQGRFARVAQMVLYLWSVGKTMGRVAMLQRGKEYLDAYAAYTDRHLHHATSQVTRSYLLDFVIESMESVALSRNTQLGGFLEHDTNGTVGEEEGMEVDGDEASDEGDGLDEESVGDHAKEGVTRDDEDGILDRLPVVSASDRNRGVPSGSIVDGGGDDLGGNLAGGPDGDSVDDDAADDADMGEENESQESSTDIGRLKGFEEENPDDSDNQSEVERDSSEEDMSSADDE